MVTPVKFSMGIESISMPMGFRKKTRPAIVSTVVDQKFCLDGSEDVRIRFFYRGMPLSSEGALAFRACIAKKPHLIFEYKPEQAVSEEALKELSELKDALDYLAGNQVMASEGEPIRFQLEELRTMELKGRTVLAIQGWFYAPGESEPQDHFYGVFFDASYGKEICHIEELLFEARSWDDFEKYFPSYKEVLNSIRWS